MKNVTNCKQGFTLAEILITLSIIGIVAALTIPALMASVDERVYTTQKKALIARFSNAVSQFDTIGGYGTGTANYTESFIMALSKVYKMNSICSASNLAACDVPETVTGLDGAEVTLIDGGTAKNLSQLNDTFADDANIKEGSIYYYENATPAAFTTVNGESVLVYYNPKCTTASDVEQNVQKITCANLIYDLNGASAPNQVGKDIGFITIISNENPTVGGPIPESKDLDDTVAYTDAVVGCKTSDGATRLPNVDEASSLYVNKFLLGTKGTDYTEAPYWTGSVISSKIENVSGVDVNKGQAWSQAFDSVGLRTPKTRDTELSVRCVKK